LTQRTLLALLLLLGAAAAGPIEYEFVPLPLLDPSRDADTASINDHRQVSGHATTSDVPADRAVIWDIAPDNSATVRDIGLLEGRRMYGRRINNQGEMTGFSYVNGKSLAFRYDGTQVTALENPFESPATEGTFPSVAVGINEQGWIVGHASTKTVGPGNYVATLWEPSGTMHVLGTLGGTLSFGQGISERFVCGASEISVGSQIQRAYRWDFETGTMELLDLLPEPTHTSGTSLDVNNHGDIVGQSSFAPYLPGPDALGVVWYADGTMRRLDGIGTPGVDDNNTVPGGINDAGWVIGSCAIGAYWDFHRHPLLWLPDGSTVDFISLIPADKTYVQLWQISNTGWICGNYQDPSTGRLLPFALRPSPATQIGMLMDQVDRLDLGRIGKGLNLQLKVALKALTDGRTRNDRAAAVLLAVFRKEIPLLEHWHMIDDIDADSVLVVVDDALATLRGE